MLAVSSIVKIMALEGGKPFMVDNSPNSNKEPFVCWRI